MDKRKYVIVYETKQKGKKVIDCALGALEKNRLLAEYRSRERKGATVKARLATPSERKEWFE